MANVEDHLSRLSGRAFQERIGALGRALDEAKEEDLLRILYNSLDA
jgi:hypothetical protein